MIVLGLLVLAFCVVDFIRLSCKWRVCDVLNLVSVDCLACCALLRFARLPNAVLTCVLF